MKRKNRHEAAKKRQLKFFLRPSSVSLSGIVVGCQERSGKAGLATVGTENFAVGKITRFIKFRIGNGHSRSTI